MTSNEKFKAMAALDQWVSIRMDVNDQWYLAWNLEIGGDGILDGKCGRGASPEAAIEAHWKLVTELPHVRYLVKDAYSTTRKHFRWSGFMWEELAQEQTKA